LVLEAAEQMYELIERKLNDKEIRLLRFKIGRYESEVFSPYKAAAIWVLLSYGVAGLIVLAGNLLSKEETPVWFTLLIFFGVGTFLFVTALRTLFRQNRDNSRMIAVLKDALAGGSARVETISCKRFIEVEEFEDEGACYLFEIDDKRLFLLFGQEYYSDAEFPSTDFSLVDILDANRNPIDSYVEKRGEKLKPYRIISASDKLKEVIPYDEKFINCGLDELDSYMIRRVGL